MNDRPVQPDPLDGPSPEAVRQMMLDLLYGELDPDEAERVRRAIGADAELDAEFRLLKRGRTALAVWAADEPAARPQPIPAVRDDARPAIRVLRWGFAAAAVAAAVLIVVFLGRFGQGDPTNRAGGGRAGIAGVAHAARPIIERTDLAVTILSTPRWSEGRLATEWPGLAQIRDRRVAADLPEGVSEVRLTGIPAGIDATSVRLSSLDRPRGLAALEQNYQYDLATAGAVLDRYVDKPVTLVLSGSGDPPGRDGPTVTGTLLAHEPGQLVLDVPGSGVRSVARGEVAAVRLEELPEGLRTRPTLVWKLDNAAARNQAFQVSYLTRGLSWRADYVLTLSADAPRAVERTEPRSGLACAEYYDLADLTGWATVTNRSGVTLPKARLKLLAGDVNLQRPKSQWTAGGRGGGVEKVDRFLGLEEQGFFEYHLYTLPRPTTLADNETKQVRLAAGRGAWLRRRYVYHASVGNEAVDVYADLLNSKANRLGIALPKGVVRLYAPDPAGRPAFAKATRIDHTPRDETIELNWGAAFDLAGRTTHLQSRKAGRAVTDTYRYALHNAKAIPVTVTVAISVARTTTRLDCPLPWWTPAVGRVEVDVPLAAGQRRTFDVTLTHGLDSGGGLTSPYPHRPKLKDVVEKLRNGLPPEQDAADARPGGRTTSRPVGRERQPDLARP